MSTDTGAPTFRRGWQAVTWVNYPTSLPKPANASPEGRARKARQLEIEILEERRQLAEELADW